MPASKDTCFTVKLLPGGGRLLRIVPFASAPKINNGAIHTNFKFAEITPNVSTPLSQDSIQVTQKYYVKTQADTAANPDYISYYWAADTSDWLPYSASSIKYLENSVDNKANIFELQFKIGGGKILTPKYSAQILFNDVPPVNGAITINNNANFTNSQTVNVKLSGTDLFPGLSQMRFAEKPFGSDSGYVNLVKNGTFADTANWTLDNAEFYDGFLHLKGVHTGPGPAQIGSSAKQIIPGSEINPHRNKLFRLSDDIYSHDVISSYKYVDVFYADSLFPNGVRLLDKPIASTPEVVWKASSDTFTLKVDTARSLDRIEISYNIFGIQLPPPPPDPGTLFNTIAVDNIRLEPVELKTGALPDNVPQNTYVFDGWGYADTNYPLYYKLSPDDGTKRVYMQLKDLPGNISSEPGWYDDIILDMTKPAVSLDIPLDLSYVNGTVPVCGWSADQNFKDWTLDCQPYASDNWQALFTNTTHINVNGPYYSMLLYSWNTDMLSDDIYMLRFTANDLAGNARADTHYVQVLTGPDLPAQAITSEFATFNSLPVDATCDNFGNIYVTDTQADKIWKFSPEGDSLLCFGYKYTCQDTLGLNHPKGIAVDDSGNIWITDCYQSKVKKYDGQGNYLSAIGKYGNQQGEFNQPTGITISGNEIYVVDHLNGRVQVFNKTGAFIRQFGNNYLNQPAGIAIRNNEAEKLVYVCDSQNDRVAIFDTTGNLVNSIDSLGLDKPWDICFDNNNNLYIADVYNNRVIELDPWHNKLLTFGIQGQEAGQFKLPQGLAVSPDGKYLYVADTHNDRLQRFKMFFDMGTLGGAQFAGKRQIANSAPTVFGLSQCYPNPCKQATNINYQIAQPGNVRIKIYNTLGQVVKTLVSENQQPGYYSINWDGRDECTRQVAAGIYFYRLQAGSFSSTKKAVMLR
ncbi:SMP-30/gluconolactonase/LRE family protein [candidate division TA06 bacterium]|nr:SMP-30/gluconolactonase/LRE family protein [candidate division TA06 bacterium]